MGSKGGWDYDPIVYGTCELYSLPFSSLSLSIIIIIIIIKLFNINK
jgi:hypothetical protein